MSIQKVLIDTDIGGDVDDALALTAALRCPEIEVVGLTTVYLRPEWRAQVACEILERCGKNIPVAAGCGAPFHGHWDEVNIPDTGITSEKSYVLSSLSGCDLIIQMAERYPDLTILAIGPLTNLALALRKSPQLFQKCRVFVMGGRLFNSQPEWNIQCDPIAADIVFQSGLDISLVPFDLTHLCQFTQQEVDEFTGTPYREFLKEMMNLFTARFGFLPMMHDPMALAMLVRPDLFTFEQRRIAVETQGCLTNGTLVDYGATSLGNIRAAVNADLHSFKKWIRELLMNG